ncbi:solute carrier family 23 protein [Acetobacter sp. LMG 32666]|uniref:solute carrier family 23 protein n=1 Tax=Acetobacter sp. LMG 32666 TaxID=2959295 RepID=UPI0030C7DFCB
MKGSGKSMMRAPTPQLCKTSDPHGVDAVLPITRMLPLAVQHVMVMYMGAITVPLVIGRVLALPAAQTATLIQADLLTSGMATLLQTVGTRWLGARLPLMQGVSFATVSCVIGIASSPTFAQSQQNEGLRTVYGAVIVAGLAAILAAPLGRYVMKLFPPIVVGTSLAIMGLSLLPVAVNEIAVGTGIQAGTNMLVAMSVFACAIALSIAGRGVFKNLAVIIGVALGLVVAFFAGQVSPHLRGMPPLLAPVAPFPLGWPIFHLMPSLSMIVIVAITWVESVGDAVVVGEMTNRPATPERVSKLLRADGVATLLGGIMGSFPYTAFSENVALLSITGVRSRWIVALAGGILCVLGFSPFLAAAVAALPPAVAGGAGLMIFGTLMMVGIQMLASLGLEPGNRPFIVASVSIVLAMAIVLKPDFFCFMPQWTQSVLQSPVVTGCLSAIALNIILSFSAKNR